MFTPALELCSRLAPNGECLIWDGTLDPDGYGRIRFNKRHYLIHRFMFQLAYHPIPNEMVIDHQCRHRACINPWHLQAVTPLENTRRRTPFRIVTSRPDSSESVEKKFRGWHRN